MQAGPTAPTIGTGISASGQFTQEDPIGIAGGLNLYGYAGGDPVNFSDPFGTCKVSARWTRVAGIGRHGFVVTEDPDGSAKAYRAGPEKDGPNDWGQIEAESGELEESQDYQKEVPEETQVLVDDDEPCDEYDAIFGDAAQAIQGARIPYDPLARNSNSFAYTLLLEAGLAGGVRNPWYSPGWGLNLIPRRGR